MIYSHIGLPWYKQVIDIKWAFYLGLGVKDYQLDMLNLDLSIIVVYFFYFVYFSYSHLKHSPQFNVERTIKRYITNSSFRKSVLMLTEDFYSSFAKTVLDNFNITLMNYTELKRMVLNYETMNKFAVKNTDNESELDEERDESMFSATPNENNIYSNNNRESYATDNQRSSNMSNENNLKSIEDNNNLGNKKNINNYDFKKTNTKSIENNIKAGKSIVDGVKRFFFLSMHTIILCSILVFSINIIGLISIFYSIVAFYYLFKSINFIQGLKFSYPWFIRKVLVIVLFVDIVLQIIYQIPFNIHLKDKPLGDFLDILGFPIIIDYDKIDSTDKKVYINFELLNGLMIKALAFYMISIQSVIFSSKDFKEKYLVNVIKFKKKQSKYSLIYSYAFNNKRIEAMKEVTNNREK